MKYLMKLAEGDIVTGIVQQTEAPNEARRLLNTPRHTKHSAAAAIVDKYKVPYNTAFKIVGSI